MRASKADLAFAKLSMGRRPSFFEMLLLTRSVLVNVMFQCRYAKFVEGMYLYRTILIWAQFKAIQYASVDWERGHNRFYYRWVRALRWAHQRRVLHATKGLGMEQIIKWHYHRYPNHPLVLKMRGVRY